MRKIEPLRQIIAVLGDEQRGRVERRQQDGAPADLAGHGTQETPRLLTRPAHRVPPERLRPIA
jgi:hypothetical protein